MNYCGIILKVKMEVKQILVDQFNEIEEKIKSTRTIKREFEDEAKERAKSKLIKVTTGIRRAGKSFFTHFLLKGRAFGYVNFDDEVIADTDPNKILSSLLEIHGKINVVFMDEIQNLRKWELFVNRLHRAGYDVFITGSNAKLLSSDLATHLTGRHIPLELFPFSFREYLMSADFNEDVESTRGKSLLKHELDNYIKSGGFPEVVVEKENPRIYLKELYRNIIEKDIVFKHNLKYKKTFKEVAFTVLSNFGGYVSYNKLKNQFSLGSDHTIKNYLSYLNESYLILPISKFSFKSREIEKSNKKIYVIDTGIINNAAINFTPNSGKIIENIAAVELLRRKSYRYLDWEIFYWKDSQQNEVDFVIKEGHVIKELIQATYASSINDIEKRELKALIKAGAELKCNNLSIITWDYEGEENIENKKICFTPLWKWLLKF